MKTQLLLLLPFFFFTTAAHGAELADLLSRAEKLADMTNAFATRCENDIRLEKTADTEDCDKFLETHALWREADDTFHNRYGFADQPEEREWKSNNEYRLKAYKHLLQKTKRAAIKINGMIQKIP